MTESPQRKRVCEDNDSQFACNECKRRRLKCSRDVPTCSLCLKHHRHCLYEKTNRSPLTRKHLTQVEEELRISRKVIQRHFPTMDISRMVQEIKNGSNIDELIDLFTTTQSSPTQKNSSPTKNNIKNLLTIDDGLEDLQVPQLVPSSVTENGSHKSSTDLSPVSYNWDERNLPHGNRQASIIDGIATMDTNGYLGSPSSAALINLVGGGFFFHKPHGDGGDGNHVNEEVLTNIPRNTLEGYINQYFQTFHVSYPIIYEPIFMAHFNEIIVPPQGWESLMYMVAAIGSFMSGVSPEQNDDLTLFELAKSKLSMEIMERGNLTLVTTITLMSNYLQKRDKPNSGYSYLGLAVRMALGLGIHREIDRHGESLLEKEMRRRIWWCLYIFDCGQNITFGRPLCIPCAGIDTSLPMNIPDSCLTALTKQMPVPENEPTIYTSVRLQSLLHLLTNGIYERIITDPFPSASQLLARDKKYLERWKKLVPPYYDESASVGDKFKLSKCVLEWRFRNLRILMYRTFLLKRVVISSQDSSDQYERQAGEICLQECSKVIKSMNHFWCSKPDHNRMETWYTLCFVVPAALMPLVCLRNNPSSANADSWRNDVITAQNIIASLTSICPSAAKLLDLISTLGHGYLYTQPNATSPEPTATDESPTSQLLQLHSMLWPVSFDLEQQFNLT